MPRWLASHLGINSAPLLAQHLHPEGHAVAERRLTPEGLVAGRICAPCNNGWLSQLESSVQPVLAPLMDGRRAIDELSITEATMVALWATKTAYVLNLFSGFEGLAKPDHIRHLYRARAPIAGTFVFGAQHGHTDPFSWFQTRQLQFVTKGPPPPPPHVARLITDHCYKIGLQFGDLILITFFWPIPHWPVTYWAGVHSRLWPRFGQRVSLEHAFLADRSKPQTSRRLLVQAMEAICVWSHYRHGDDAE